MYIPGCLAAFCGHTGPSQTAFLTTAPARAFSHFLIKWIFISSLGYEILKIFQEYFPLLPACPSLIPRPSPILEAERAANIHRKPTMSERGALFGPNKANNLSFLIKGSVEFGASDVGVRKGQRQLEAGGTGSATNP